VERLERRREGGRKVLPRSFGRSRCGMMNDTFSISFHIASHRITIR
jgi:hypothetical protein